VSFGNIQNAFGLEGASRSYENIESIRTLTSPLQYTTTSNPTAIGMWFALNANAYVPGRNENEASVNATNRTLHLQQSGANAGASDTYRSAYWNCWRVLATSVPNIRSYFDLKYTVTARSTTGNTIRFMLEYGDTLGTPSTYRSIEMPNTLGTHTVSFFNDLKTTLSMRLNYAFDAASGIDSGTSTITFKDVILTQKYRETD
tara:strand:+ start:10770 stop:11375 length:606 start_codon:yes stop_codon:yes gene_type:complete